MIYTEQNINNRVLLARKCFSNLCTDHLQLVQNGCLNEAKAVFKKMKYLWGAINAMCGYELEPEVISPAGFSSFVFDYAPLNQKIINDGYTQFTIDVPDNFFVGQVGFSFTASVTSAPSSTNIPAILAQYVAAGIPYHLTIDTVTQEGILYAPSVGENYNGLGVQVILGMPTSIQLEGNFSGGEDTLYGSDTIRTAQTEYAKSALRIIDCLCPTVCQSC